MSAVTADIPSTDVEEKKVPLKVAFSSFLGNFIEWFDYATYTYFAITIGQVFVLGLHGRQKGQEVVSVRLYSLHDRCSVPYRLPAVFRDHWYRLSSAAACTAQHPGL